MKIEPLDLPQIAIENRKELPPIPGVYFVIHGSKVIYIGESGNLYLRWKNHHRIKYILSEYPGSTLAWLPTGTKEIAREIEQNLIADLKPPLNGNDLSELKRVGLFISEDNYKWIKLEVVKTDQNMSEFVDNLLTKLRTTQSK